MVPTGTTLKTPAFHHGKATQAFRAFHQHALGVQGHFFRQADSLLRHKRFLFSQLSFPSLLAKISASWPIIYSSLAPPQCLGCQILSKTELRLFFSSSFPSVVKNSFLSLSLGFITRIYSKLLPTVLQLLKCHPLKFKAWNRNHLLHLSFGPEAGGGGASNPPPSPLCKLAARGGWRAAPPSAASLLPVQI